MCGKGLGGVRLCVVRCVYTVIFFSFWLASRSKDRRQRIGVQSMVGRKGDGVGQLVV